MSRPVWLTCIAMLAAFSSGCALTGPRVQLENLTDTPVAVHVNGSWVGTYPPGARVGIPIGLDPPFSIKVITASGAVLASVAVDIATYDEVVAGTAGIGQRALVPCGRVNLWLGLYDPSGPQVEGPPPSGPCP